MADKYKVETLSYIYEWLDVGPGSRERGNILRMGSMLRNYRKTYHDLSEAVKEFEKLQKIFPEKVVIISKFIDKEYVPGKVIIIPNSTPLWQLIDRFYDYGWKRINTKAPLFDITIDDKVPDIVSQKRFFERKLTFSELAKTGVLCKAFTDKDMSRYMAALPLSNCMYRYTGV